MMAITKLLAGGAAMAALAGAAPATAQYYPGYGYGYQSPSVVVDRVLNDVVGGGAYGYGGYGGYGLNSQAVVNMCVNTIQARLGGGYAYGAYGYGDGGRVLGISRVEPRSTGGIRVRGVASSGMNAGYGYGYGYNQRPDLTWKCSVDLRGAIVGLDIQRAYPNYSEAYTPWGSYGGNYDYSQYGYRRY